MTDAPEKPFRYGHRAMRTDFAIFIAGQNAEYAASAASAAFRELEKVEEKLSRFIASSDIARANALRAGEATHLSGETWDCLATAARIAGETERAFDPACGVLIDFWKHCSNIESGFEPSNDAAWQAAWEAHRRGAFSLDAETRSIVCAEPGCKLDLGAIGKGFALDVMARVLEEDWGVSNMLLSAGGSTVLALDAPPEREGWVVGFGAESQLPPVTLTRRALSSSGTGTQKTHLVDPRNGFAVSRADIVRSLAENAAVADALSTAFFVMSPGEVAAYCRAHPGREALFANNENYRT